MKRPRLDPEIKKELRKEELFYTTDKRVGFFRQKIGEKEFAYYGLNGQRISEEETLKRIESLGIPPAWKRVWISPLENTHLQATGIDEKGRKQYIYHLDWVKITQENKFSKMIDFGLSLPKIRNKVRYFMQETTLSKKNIIATIVWLLEHTFLRIGNEEYTKENDSFGLTTLRNRHVRVRGSEIEFNFKGKSGVEVNLSVTNKLVAKTIKKCIELPGYELFQYMDSDGQKRVVDSADVNEFLKGITKHDFTAKDFRTWGATDLSANIFFKIGHSSDKKLLKKNITAAVKQVAHHLNNTTKVCRSYYIHPTVIKTYEDNVLVPHFQEHEGQKPQVPGLSWDEVALVKLLQQHS